MRACKPRQANASPPGKSFFDFLGGEHLTSRSTRTRRPVALSTLVHPVRRGRTLALDNFRSPKKLYFLLVKKVKPSLFGWLYFLLPLNHRFFI